MNAKPNDNEGQPEPATYTVKDVARRLKCSVRHIRRMNVFSDFLAAFMFSHRDVILALKVEPELRVVAKIAAKTQGRVGADRTPAVQNVGDAA